jgi:hypothetical protein
MVGIRLATVYAALFVLMSCGQAPDTQRATPGAIIEVSLTKPMGSFSNLQQVEVRVSNLSKDKLSYTCALEMLSEGEWLEVSPSIFSDDPPRGTRILELRPSAEAVFRVDPPQAAVEPSASGRFRVKATALEGEKVLAESTSAEFQIGSSVPSGN